VGSAPSPLGGEGWGEGFPDRGVKSLHSAPPEGLREFLNGVLAILKYPQHFHHGRVFSAPLRL